MRSSAKWFAGVSIGLALMAISSTARAQDYEAAGKHFQAAQDALKKSDFKAAMIEYDAAYQITKDPVLLYNIGEVWEAKATAGKKPKDKKADAEKAIAAYHRYLIDAPTAEDHAAVTTRVADLQKKYAIKANPADKAAEDKAVADAKAPPKPADVKPVVADDKAAAEKKLAEEKAAADKAAADKAAANDPAKHFTAAQEAMKKSDFKTALTEYDAAYQITKDPVLLYNIGEVWEAKAAAEKKPKDKKPDAEKAIGAYHRYLVDAPLAADHAAVTTKSDELAKKYAIKTNPADRAAEDKAVADAKAAVDKKAAEDKAIADAKAKADAEKKAADEKAAAEAKLAEEKAAADKAAAEAKAAEEKAAAEKLAAAAKDKDKDKGSVGLLDDEKATHAGIAAWSLAAATVALVVAGAIFGLAAQSDSDELSRQLKGVDQMTMQPPVYDAAHQATIEGLRNDGQTYNSVAIVMLGAAGVAAIASGVAFYMDHKSPAKETHAHLLPSLAPHTAGLTAGVEF